MFGKLLRGALALLVAWTPLSAAAQSVTGNAVPLFYGSKLVTLPGSNFDLFRTTTSAMNGTSFTPYTGATWVQDGGINSVTTNPSVPSAGVLSITNATLAGARAAIWNHPPATSAQRWLTVRINPVYALSTATGAVNNFNLQTNEIVITPNTSYAQIAYTFEAAGVGLGATRVYHSLSGSLANTTTADVYPASSITSKKQGDFWRPWAGDTIQIRKVTSGSVVTYDFYSGGYPIASNTVDMAAAYTGASLALNDNGGILGSQTQAATPNLLSFFENTDPCSQAALTVKMIGHTAQIKFWDGSNDTYVRLKGDYSLTPPSSLQATAYNATTGAVIYGPIKVSNFARGPPTSCVGTWSGNITIPAGSTTANFYVDVERTDVIGLQTRHAYTPVLNAGWIGGTYGQSLDTQLWQKTEGSITVTPPANVWVGDGSLDQGGGGFPGANNDIRSHISTANTSPYNNNVSNLVYMAQPVVTASGNANLGITFIRGGYGGTLQSERSPLGSNANATHGIFEIFAEGIDRIGDIGFVWLNGGTYETNAAPSIFSNTQTNFVYGTDTIPYKALIDSMVSAIETQVGHPIRMLLAPPPGIDATNTTTLNNRSNAMARAYWELIQTNGGFGVVTALNPQRYYPLAYTYELQHASGDQYHLNVAAADGYAEMARRYGYSLAQVLGYAATDRNGGTIDDTTQPQRHVATFDVTLNARGATSVTCDNTAFASDFRCGLHFYKTGTATEVLPITLAPTCTAVSGGKSTCTWTFSPADLATAIDVTGPAGLTPYNQASNATISSNMMTDASMLRFHYADPESTFFNPPLQPYFNPSFLTNNTHDFVTSN